MKKFAKFFTMLIAIAMLVSMFAMTVSAEALDGAVSGADAAPEETPVTISASAKLTGYDLEKISLEDYGVEILVPDFETVVTADSTNADVFAKMGFGMETLLSNGYLVYGVSSDTQDIVYVTYDVTDYSRKLGSYADLSESEREAMIKICAAEFEFDEADVSFSSINGIDYILASSVEDETDSEGVTSTVRTDVLKTVYNGVEYQIGMRFVNATSAEDAEVINSIRNSVKISKGDLGFAFDGGAGMSAVEIVLLVAVILLAAAVAYLLASRKDGKK